MFDLVPFVVPGGRWYTRTGRPNYTAKLKPPLREVCGSVPRFTCSCRVGFLSFFAARDATPVAGYQPRTARGKWPIMLFAGRPRLLDTLIRAGPLCLQGPQARKGEHGLQFVSRL